MSILLTLILVQDLAHASGSQTPRELELRLLQIQEALKQNQEALKQNDVEREKAVVSIGAKIDHVDDSIGPKLDNVGRGLIDLTTQVKEVVRIAAKFEPLFDDLGVLVKILVFIVGGGGTAWTGKQLLNVGRESKRINRWLPNRRDPHARTRTEDAE